MLLWWAAGNIGLRCTRAGVRCAAVCFNGCRLAALRCGVAAVAIPWRRIFVMLAAMCVPGLAVRLRWFSCEGAVRLRCWL